MPVKTVLTPDLPWPGTAPYGPADRAYFHGRKRETEELLRLIQRDVLTLVIGAASVGKTSLIQAGLLPALSESEWLTVTPALDWSATPPKSDAPDLDPGAAVSLANSLSRTLFNSVLAAAEERNLASPEPHPGETLWEFFHRAGNRWWSARQHVVTPIVVIDGFESVFTTASENATAQRQAAGFLKELSQLAANRPPQRLATRLEKGQASESDYDFDAIPLRIVFVMREEFAPQLSSLRPFFPTLRRSELRIEPFTTSQAREVLVRGSLQCSLMSDAALDATVAHLASGRGTSGGISPAKLSELAHDLASARRERGAAQITPDFLPKPDDNPMRVAETSASPVFESTELREKLEASERRLRSSERAALLAVIAVILAVAVPIAQKRLALNTATVASRVPANSHPVPPPPALPKTPPSTSDQSAAFESPFTLASPEYLPSTPVKASPAPATPEPQPPAEWLLEEQFSAARVPAAQPAPPPDAGGAPPGSASATARPATPSPDQSALSPDARRQLDAAAADRKEQQRREFLKRQESRRSKDATAR
jgi:hypothetical protein